MTAPVVQRRGRGKAQATLELIEACQEILAEVQPASVRESIWRFIDEDLWNHAATVERAEVESMQRFHDAWTKRISGQATK